MSTNGRCLDSDCTVHLSKEKSFREFGRAGCSKVSLANDASAPVMAEATVRILTTDGYTEKLVDLENTSFVYNLRTNLALVSKITNFDFEVMFKKDRAIVTKNGIT